MKPIQFARTSNIIVTLVLVMGTAVACKMPAALATPTATAIPTATASPTPTPRPKPASTFTPTIWIPPTRTPNATATAEYNNMFTIVNDFYKQGYIPVLNGTYYPMDSYLNTWAEIGWYSWHVAVSSAVDFILTAHMAWDSASKTPNESGCGITFHEQPDKEHYVIFVLSTGNIQFGMSTDRYHNIGYYPYGQPATKGEVDFSMIAVGNKFDFFVNNRHINTYTGFQNKMLDGELGFTVLSGTNAGFGTKCEITRDYLWKIQR